MPEDTFMLSDSVNALISELKGLGFAFEYDAIRIKYHTEAEAVYLKIYSKAMPDFPIFKSSKLIQFCRDKPFKWFVYSIEFDEKVQMYATVFWMSERI